MFEVGDGKNPTDSQQALLNALGTLMSAASEKNFFATWLDGTEETLPKKVAEYVATGRWPVNPGDWHVSHDQAMAMHYLAKLLGCWATYHWTKDGGDRYLPYDPESLR